MDKKPSNFEEARKIGISSAFENSTTYYIVVGNPDTDICPIYGIDKRTGEYVDGIGTAEIVLDYEIRDELDPSNPKIIRRIDPKTIKL